MSKRARLSLLAMPSVVLSSIEASSDSSSDEDEIHRVCEEKFVELFGPRNRVPKIVKYIENVVRAYSDKEFRKNFRLPRKTCYEVIEQFGNSAFWPSEIRNGGSPAKTPEEHILSFLWYAANKASMREVAVIFNMAESTQLLVVERVLKFLCSIAPSVIYFPRDKDAAARDFEKLAQFPGVIGCIDGTYVPIRCPANKIRSTYVNRHDQVSLTMQGICDANGRFEDVFTGTPSKIHDARVLRLSTVSDDLPQICEGNKYHLLGDAAYPIREYLLTPYKNYGNITNEQSLYNQHHSATRVVVENGFGLLKQRFRQLRYIELTTVDKIAQFIMACCVLHNICLDAGDTQVDDILSGDERAEIGQDRALLRDHRRDREQHPSRSARETMLKRLGELKRESLARRFSRLQLHGENID